MGNCYGKNIFIKPIKKLRATKKFANQLSLIKQTKKDIAQAKNYFKTHGQPK
ncbi:hypothetical protein KKI23_03195 [Patescibacteria group bacterium]|nr:hypothetical protein [Patescibacteria group bacterium]